MLRALGFDGKWAVHPDQVAVMNEVFTPGADELERARAIVAALAAPRAAARSSSTGRWSTRRAASSRSTCSRAPGRGVGAVTTSDEPLSPPAPVRVGGPWFEDLRARAGLRATRPA